MLCGTAIPIRDGVSEFDSLQSATCPVGVDAHVSVGLVTCLAWETLP